MNNNDIICAPATVPGTGAISVIRVSGKGSLELADKVISSRKGSIAQSKGYTLHFGSIFASDGSLLDEVIVSVFRAPNSYTGEDGVEISCHSSKYIVSETIGLLCEKGCRMAGPGEFTQRAYLNGKMDLAQAEAVADVIAADSKAALRVAQSQLRGEYSAAFKELRDALVRLSALVELELDFSEEDVEFASRDELAMLVKDALGQICTLASSFKRGNAVKNGLPVAIIGPANSGKSTLLNAIIGEDRAIVSDIAGTTRDTIEEVLNVGGVSLRFIDTAGIRDTDETVEKIGIGRSLKKMQEASIILGILDPARGFSSMKEDVQFFLSNVDLSEQKLILVLNKIDLIEDGNEADSAVNKNVIRGNEIVSLIENKSIDIPLVKISAKTGEGLVDLMSTLSNKASDLVGTSDSTLVTNLRHYEALRKSEAPLRRVLSGLGATDHGTPLPPDLIAQDLREALHYIGSIVGEISTDEVLGSIFREFCVGK